jgi:hypothetical protein
MTRIIPDYSRHTDITLEDRLILADLARVRLNVLTSYRIAKEHHRQLVEAKGDLNQIEDYDNRIIHLRWTIESIDGEILAMYVRYGMVN